MGLGKVAQGFRREELGGVKIQPKEERPHSIMSAHKKGPEVSPNEG